MQYIRSACRASVQFTQFARRTSRREHKRWTEGVPSFKKLHGRLKGVNGLRGEDGGRGGEGNEMRSHIGAIVIERNNSSPLSMRDNSPVRSPRPLFLLVRGRGLKHVVRIPSVYVSDRVPVKPVQPEE